MKKFNFKNYIAFTLAEMTLVLLITGVIAVATTPIITSALSDSSAKGGPSVTEVTEVPWRVASKYNGGGIFNIPSFTYSITSIGLKPGAQVSSYNYASLLIQSNSTNNIANAPQIQLLTDEVFDNGDIQYTYTNIAADEFQNFAFTYGNSFQSQKVGSNDTNNLYLGAHNVFMGGNIQSDSDAEKAYYDKSIFLGHNINTAYAINSIFVGSNIEKKSNEQNSVNIGFDMEPYNRTGSEYSSADNVNIGLSAGSGSYGSYNVNVGKSAAVDSKLFNSVVIGTQAGQGLGYYSNIYSQTLPLANRNVLHANMDNVILGYRAGYSTITPVVETHYTSGNTLIGKYAGAFESTDTPSTSASNSYAKFANNTVIGNYAGLYKFTTSPVHEYENNLMLGDYAGYAWSTGTGLSNRRTVRNSVDIGYYAGSGTWRTAGSEHIFIGDHAGADASIGSGNIFIGSYAGSKTTSANGNMHTTAIGYYAGYSSSGSYSIYVGYYAGLNSNKYVPTIGGVSNDNSPQYASVGIGSQTCQEITKGGKWCLGSGTLQDTITYSSVEVWNKSSKDNQMVIGFVDKGTSGQTITLYASKVLKNSGLSGVYASVVSNLSDKRLKTNIVPSKHSIEDIRKINIYDYNMKDDIRKTPRIGILAQEYRKIFPQDVTKDPQSKKLRAAANWMIFSMVNAVKDVDIFIQNLQAEFKAYTDDFAGLKSKVAKLEKQAKQIEKENAQMREHLAKINAKLK